MLVGTLCEGTVTRGAQGSVGVHEGSWGGVSPTDEGGEGLHLQRGAHDEQQVDFFKVLLREGRSLEGGSPGPLSLPPPPPNSGWGQRGVPKPHSPTPVGRRSVRGGSPQKTRCLGGWEVSEGVGEDTPPFQIPAEPPSPPPQLTRFHQPLALLTFRNEGGENPL